jgi:hypothetical protein
MKPFNQRLAVLSVIALSCCTQLVSAQSVPADTLKKDHLHIVKMNVAALVTKTFSFQLERAVGKKISVAVAFSAMPESKLPFTSTFEDLADADDEDTRKAIRDFRISNISVTPEVRFYLGKKGVFHGFYVAPFGRYAKYNIESPIQVTVTQLNQTERIVFNGDVKTFTGGVMIGAQWQLSKLIYLDWWILGPNFGSSSGSLTGVRPLNTLEQSELRNQLSDLLDDVPLVNPTYTVDNNGANIKVKGQWAGLRGGLAVGFRF